MISRRKLLFNAGALTVYFSLNPVLAANAKKTSSLLPRALKHNPELDAWLSLDKRGKVKLFSGKVELGQGILTAFAQIVAEQLNVAMTRVEIINTDTRLCPDLGYTFGGISIEHGGAALQWAAAEAKAILLSYGADYLAAETSQLSVEDGEFYLNNQPSGITYWQVLADSRFGTQSYGTGVIEPSSEHSIVGTSAQRVDIPAKAFGQAAFIQDMRFSDMWHARIVGPPVSGAALIDINFESKYLSAGQHLVQDGSFLAIVGKREESVVQDAQKIAKNCQWSRGIELPDETNLVAWLKSAANPAETVAQQGQRESNSRLNYSAQFSRPYQAHASLAPSMAIAKLEGQQLTVWSHAQGMFPLRSAIARLLGMKVAMVRCIHVPSCGCYGHNGADDAACDAALIATKLPGRTIRLQYSRQDEFLREPYTSAMAVEIDASVTKQGKIQSWDYQIWSCAHSSRPGGAKRAGNFLAASLIEKSIDRPAPTPIPQPRGGSDRNAVPLYAVPNLRVRRHLVPETPLRTSSLRTLGAFTNVLAIEACMDQLAMMVGADPIDFRIKNLQDERAIHLLETLRAVSNWDARAGERGRGIGFARYKNSAAYCAVAFFVRVDKVTGEITLEKAVSVTDAGRIINPDGVKNQIEGGIIQAASWCLKERVRFSSTRIKSRHWGEYPVLGFNEVPELETHIVNRVDQLSYGVGEASPGPAGAALGNAIADALGVRLHDIPFTSSSVLQALRNASEL